MYRNTYQHGSSKVELLFKLCNEDMSVHKIVTVHCLYLSDDVRHPLKLLLCSCYP